MYIQDHLLRALLKQALQVTDALQLQSLQSDAATVVRSDAGWMMAWQFGIPAGGIPLKLTISDGPVTRILNLALQSATPPRLVLRERAREAEPGSGSLPKSAGWDDLCEIAENDAAAEEPAWSPVFGSAGEMASAELRLQDWMEDVEPVEGAQVCIAGLPDGVTLSSVSGVLFSAEDCFQLAFEDLEGLQISMPADLAGFHLRVWGIDAGGEPLKDSRLDLQIIVQSSLDGSDVVYGEVLRFTGSDEASVEPAG